ncbi:hypothetical protein C8J57DRAFT_1229855 [Mycena rebaudengoi]|nr:hypothetical protein C8J57DRAFT_1229855 [Mycena rebaudengoi]
MRRRANAGDWKEDSRSKPALVGNYRLPSESPGISCMRMLFIALLSSFTSYCSPPSTKTFNHSSSPAMFLATIPRGPPSATPSYQNLPLPTMLAISSATHPETHPEHEAMSAHSRALHICLSNLPFLHTHLRTSVASSWSAYRVLSPTPFPVGFLWRPWQGHTPGLGAPKSPWIPLILRQPSNPPSRPDFRIVERSSAPRLLIAPPMLSPYSPPLKTVVSVLMRGLRGPGSGFGAKRRTAPRFRMSVLQIAFGVYSLFDDLRLDCKDHALRRPFGQHYYWGVLRASRRERD